MEKLTVTEGAEKDESSMVGGGGNLGHQRAPEITSSRKPVQQTDTGGLMLEHPGDERTMVKELGKIIP